MDWPAARDPAVTFLNNLHAQTATSLECASTMSIHTRVSRWILMASERIGPEIPITQDALSHYLGVRRAGVTEALQEIEAANAIERRRGRIVVRDRAALEGRAAHRKQINGAHGRLPTSTLLA
jgi:CRP-like cAMP-binding protein